MATTQAAKKDIERRNTRRKADIEEVKKTHEYYSVRGLLNTDGHIDIAIGQRSNGKTWSSLDYVLDAYNAHKYTFTYVRRWAEDISVRTMTELFSKSNLKKYFGPDAKISFRTGEFILKRDEDSTPEVIGYTAALNQVAHTKGRNFPNCRTIIFDEFLAMLTERGLKDEIDAWEQTISTIFRIEPEAGLMKDRKIIMLGNTVTKYSPYFKHYGIDTHKLKQGEILSVNLTNPTNGKVTRIRCEYCKYNPRVGEETSVFVVGSKMAQTGEFEVPATAEIPYTDGESTHDSMLMSMYDDAMDQLIGVYVRKTTWYTENYELGVFKPTPHHRSFLIVKPALQPSSYYHLTTIKDLKYGTWNNKDRMLKAILDETEIDVQEEIDHGRVYCSDQFIAENFVQSWARYSPMGMKFIEKF